jgi:hypothetical protein
LKGLKSLKGLKCLKSSPNPKPFETRNLKLET